MHHKYIHMSGRIILSFIERSDWLGRGARTFVLKRTPQNTDEIRALNPLPPFSLAGAVRPSRWWRKWSLAETSCVPWLKVMAPNSQLEKLENMAEYLKTGSNNFARRAKRLILVVA